MHILSLAPVKPDESQSAPVNAAARPRLQARKPFAALGLLAVAVVALSPVASMASTRPAVTKTPTTIKITASPNPVKDGQTLTLTATMSSSKAAGTVYGYESSKATGHFTKVGSATLSNGVAKARVPIGTKEKLTVYIKAVYVPSKSSTYATSTSKVVAVVLN